MVGFFRDCLPRLPHRMDKDGLKTSESPSNLKQFYRPFPPPSWRKCGVYYTNNLGLNVNRFHDDSMDDTYTNQWTQMDIDDRPERSYR